MTATRLREVGSVTSEAIERLHKQLENMPSKDEEMEDPPSLKVHLDISNLEEYFCLQVLCKMSQDVRKVLEGTKKL